MAGYRCRKRSKFKRRAILLCALIATCAAVFVCRANFLEYVHTYSSTYIRAQLVDAVNDGTSESLEKEKYGDYETIVTVHKDAGGDIVYIHTNMLLINMYICDVLECVQTQVDNLCRDEKLQVPIAAATGLTMLAQYGPKFEFVLQPVGTVDCDYRSAFRAAGVNQTLHSIYIDIDVKVQVLLPLNSPQIALKTSMLVCENVIVGKIPDVYLQGGSIDLRP